MSAHPAILPTELLSCIQAQETPGFVRLPHPRTGLPALFLPFTSRSTDNKPGVSCILEVQSISPDAKRSWFVSPGEVVSDGKLLVLAPTDPVFILIPLLDALPSSINARFLPPQDLLDEIANVYLNSPPTAQDGSTIAPAIEPTDIVALGDAECVAVALRQICEAKEPAPGLQVFKFLPSKALELLRRKVDALATPATFGKFPFLERSLAKDGLATGIDNAGSDEVLIGQARIMASCEVISQYLSLSWKEKLIAAYNLDRLNAHLKGIAEEAQAAISRANPDPKLKDATNAPNKKPKKGSVGVEKLKKANVAGMAKLSSFFTKKA